METRVSMLCENPFCGVTLYLPFTIKPGGTFTLADLTIRCGRCGHPIHIKKRTFRVFDPASWRRANPAVLQRAITFLHDHTSSGTPAEALKQTAKNEIPELSKLWDLIPKKPAEIIALLSLFVATLTLIMNFLRGGKKEDVKLSLPPELANALTQTEPSVRKTSGAQSGQRATASSKSTAAKRVKKKRSAGRSSSEPKN